MRRMKDSGVPWIGEIPEGWVRKQIKHASEVVGSGTTPPTDIEDYYDGTVFWIQSGDIYGKTKITDTTARITDAAVRNLSALHLYKSPFIVVAMYGGSVGNIAVSDIDACTNQACCVIKTSSNNSLRFMYYWLTVAKDDFLTSAIGGTQPNISQDKIRNQFFIQPPLAEQREIADFLDVKIAEIDELKATIERQIETLEAYKRSIITEAVTKGLHPNAPMKDSGIPWIGTIPAHWDEKPIRALFSEVTQKNISLTVTNSLKFTYGRIVPKSDFDPEDDDYVQKTIANYTVVKPGVIMINGLNLNFDFVSKRIGLVMDTGIITSAYIAVDPNRQIVDPQYACYSLKSWDFHKAFHNMGGGVRKILNFSELGHKYFALPPLPEQREIASFLDEKVAEVDEMIAVKREQLVKLAEFKKSLIFEYMTGKREVPA